MRGRRQAGQNSSENEAIQFEKYHMGLDGDVLQGLNDTNVLSSVQFSGI